MASSANSSLHVPVLCREVVALLQPAVGKVVIDGTIGMGGHSAALLEAGARVIGLDKDPFAVDTSRARLSTYGERFTVHEESFSAMKSYGPADGVLLDLGVSSVQLDAPERGFSFRTDGPLDMRMSSGGLSAAELIADTPEQELAHIIYTYGEERYSRPIARRLKEALPTRTLEAAEVVKRAVPRKAWPHRTHVATRTFQALRMAVNDELGELDRALAALPETLAVAGRAAIITFHSLEDRAVKWAFRSFGERETPPTFQILTKRPQGAADDELDENPRARSAKLRCLERVT